MSDSTPPESQEGGPRPMSFLAAAGWTLVCAIVTMAAGSVLEVAHPGALHDVITLTMLRVLAVSLVFFALLRVHEPETSIRHVLALRRPSVLVTLLAIIVGAALAPVGEWLSAVVEAKFPSGPPPDPELVEHFLGTPTKRVVYFVASIAVLPLVSELFFRGALFTLLKRGRRLDAVVFATAAYDALFDQDLRQVALSFLLLLAVGWIRAFGASVIPAVLARVAFVGAQLGPEAMGKELPPATKVMAAGGLAVAVLALLAIAAISGRDPRIVEARLED